MRISTGLGVRAAVLLSAVAALAGCPDKEVPKPPTPPPSGVPKTEAVAPAQAPAAPAASEGSPRPAPIPIPSATPTPVEAPRTTSDEAPKAKPAATATPTPTATPAPTATPTAPATSTPTAPATSTHAKVGDAKCKMCHRVQHESWSSSPHAAKGVDCESCHGPGADYWPAAVMRDAARAAAAGLVKPELGSCKRCHPRADEALFARVHSHKVR